VWQAGQLRKMVLFRKLLPPHATRPVLAEQRRQQLTGAGAAAEDHRPSAIREQSACYSSPLPLPRPSCAGSAEVPCGLELCSRPAWCMTLIEAHTEAAAGGAGTRAGDQGLSKQAARRLTAPAVDVGHCPPLPSQLAPHLGAASTIEAVGAALLVSRTGLGITTEGDCQVVA